MEREIGAVIIGDEILSGKRQDRHLAHLIAALREQGRELAWLRIVGDDAELLTQTFAETHQRAAWVFSFGGIGATPDDRTRPCLARALHRPLVRHPEFVALLESRFGAEAYPNRVRMAELPAGSSLIPNPINGIPGFACAEHFCVPGFPSMAEPMVRWVLAQHLPPVDPSTFPREARLRLLGVPESRLVPILEGLEQDFPDLRFSSLPGYQEDGSSRIELGVRGRSVQVDAAFVDLQERLQTAGLVAPGVGHVEFFDA
jgi:molybdopterin-biosynthesis enzyme MoeA-like protein